MDNETIQDLQECYKQGYLSRIFTLTTEQVYHGMVIFVGNSRVRIATWTEIQPNGDVVKEDLYLDDHEEYQISKSGISVKDKPKTNATKDKPKEASGKVIEASEEEALKEYFSSDEEKPDKKLSIISIPIDDIGIIELDVSEELGKDLVLLSKLQGEALRQKYIKPSKKAKTTKQTKKAEVTETS